MELKKEIKINLLADSAPDGICSIIFIYFSPLRDDFNIKVLLAFVDLHEFADLNLVQALR